MANKSPEAAKPKDTKDKTNNRGFFKSIAAPFNSAAKTLNKAKNDAGKKLKIFRKEAPKLKSYDWLYMVNDLRKEVFGDKKAKLNLREAFIIAVAIALPAGIPIYMADRVVQHTERKTVTPDKYKEPKFYGRIRNTFNKLNPFKGKKPALNAPKKAPRLKPPTPRAGI